MSTSSASSNDSRPEDQRERAATAHLTPNEPATEAEAGTPQYGSFGKPADVRPIKEINSGANDGSNDNPDEFSDFRKQSAEVPAAPDGEPETPKNAGPQRGHVTQNQNPGAVRNAQDTDSDVQRAAWSEDDPRYAGGHAKATWQENNDEEHSND